MKRLLVAAAAAVALVACGDADDEQQAAKREVDKTPHVEGTWRAIYTPIPQDTLEEEPPKGRGTFHLASDPEVPRGRLRLHREVYGLRRPARLPLRQGVEDWVQRDRYKSDCFGQQGFGDVLAKDGYTSTSRATFQVVEAVQTKDGRRYATELSGHRIDRGVATQKAEEAGCESIDVQEDTVRVVRIDPPRGKRIIPKAGGLRGE